MTSLIHKNNLSSVNLSTKVIKANVRDSISIYTQVGKAKNQLSLHSYNMKETCTRVLILSRFKRHVTSHVDQECMCGNKTISKN
jgi:hypothetical protein